MKQTTHRHGARAVDRAVSHVPLTRLAAAAALSLLPLLGATPAHAEVRFTVTNLGTLGGPISNAYGINDAGQVVGDSYLTDSVRFRGVLWNASGMPTALAEVGGLNHQATGINASGSVVGYTTDSGGFNAPIVWCNGGFVQPDAPTTANYTRATGINSAGRIVKRFAGGTSGAMTWVSQSAGYKTLADLGGGSGAPRAVNSAGLVVGRSYDARLVQPAAVWEGGVVRGLGALGGFSNAEALAVNDLGQSVGWSPDGGPFQRSFYCGSGSMVTTNSLAAPTSFPVAAAFAPAWTRRATASGLRSKTVNSWPALRMFKAMGAPMTPRPINPTFIAKLLFDKW